MLHRHPGGWPKGGQTVVAFRNQHLSYAITWFGLAAGLLGIWLAYHISKGRLAWGRGASYKTRPERLTRDGFSEFSFPRVVRRPQ